jgi:hypothetical protein
MPKICHYTKYVIIKFETLEDFLYRRAHDVEVRGRRSGACVHELLAGRAGHLYAT